RGRTAGVDAAGKPEALEQLEGPADSRQRTFGPPLGRGARDLLRACVAGALSDAPRATSSALAWRPSPPSTRYRTRRWLVTRWPPSRRAVVRRSSAIVLMTAVYLRAS